MTKEHVMTLFETCGDVKTVRKKGPDESAAISVAVQLSSASQIDAFGKAMDGKHMIISEPEIRSIYAPIEVKVESLGSNILWVRGLPQHSTQPQLQSLFSTCGEVSKAEVTSELDG